MVGTSNKYTASGNQAATQFNPSSPYYKTICCHVRKFTIIVAIVEIFAICFLLVAVIPDISSKICETDKSKHRLHSYITLMTNGTREMTGDNLGTDIYNDLLPNSANEDYPIFNETAVPPSDNSSWYNHTGTWNQPLLILRSITCNYNAIWLTLAFVKLLAINIMFYGIKASRWYLFLPHILCRLGIIVIIVGLSALLVVGAIKGPVSSAMISIALILSTFGFIFCIVYIYFIICQVKCCHFVKKSEETGISYSSTRPVAPPTLSGSEGRPPNQGPNIPMATFANSSRPISGGGGATRQTVVARGGRGSATFDILPPLRHSYGVSGVGK